MELLQINVDISNLSRYTQRQVRKMRVKHIGRRHTLSDYQPHVHENAEILYITNGSGQMETHWGVTALAPGDIVFVPPGTCHTGPGGACGLIYMIADNPVPAHIKRPFVLRDDERQTVRMLFESVYDVYKRPDNDTAYKNVEDSLCELIFELVFSIQMNAEQDQDVAALRNVIIQGFKNPDFNLGEEMDKLTSSKTYLRRRFHEVVGMSPCKYLNALRIGYAKKLIAKRNENHLSFSQIAHCSGFHDERYFTRVFRQYCQMTPGAFYKQVV